VLKTVGLPESHLDAKVRPLFPLHPLVTFGFRTHAPENHLKLMAEAPSRTEAHAALDAAEAASRAVLGTHVFAVDEETLAGVVHAALRRRNETVGVAESCTGGLVSALLCEPAGASEVFRGGLVPYLEPNKVRWASVPAELLAAHGAVSELVARALADGARRAAESTWGVGVTGFAGPTGGTAADPVGTVYLSAAREGFALAERHFIHGDRSRVRTFAAHLAVDLLRRAAEAPR
jgi:nicotinamide-nucleotide amidase